MSVTSFGLQDSEFWTAPEKTASQVVDRLSDEEFSGVLIDAPHAVPVNLRQTLPVLCIRAGSLKELAKLSFEEHALLTAVDVHENLLYAGFTQEMEFREPENRTDMTEPADAYSADRFAFDARELLRLPWKPARYVFTVVLRDQLSNRAAVEVQESEGTFHDPEVARFLQAERMRVPAPAIWPAAGETLPSYARLEDSLPIPEAPGIALAAERVAVLSSGASCVLRGAFRLPALPQELVKPGQYPPPPEGQGPAPAPPTAVVGINLLVTGAEKADPLVLALHVPSYDPVRPGDPAPVVTGQFALDLMAIGGIARQPQTSFLYAFSGESMVGPMPIAFVSEDRLPGRRPR